MRKFLPQSISARFTLHLTGIMIFVFASFTALVAALQLSGIESKQQRRIQNLAQMIQTNLPVPLVKGNVPQVKSFVDTLFLYDDVVYFSVRTQGEEVAKKMRSSFTESDVAVWETSEEYDFRRLLLSYNYNNVGEVLFAVDRQAITNIVYYNVVFSVFGIFVIIMTVSVTAYFFVKRNVIGPIKDLEKTTGSVAAREFKKTTGEVKVEDEISSLVKNFDHMRQVLTDSLQKVERTDSLAKANRQLQLEIKERRQVEKMLIQERDRAEQYLGIAGGVIMAINRDHKITLINRKGCEVLGYTKEEIVGKDWFNSFLPKDDIDATIKIFDRLMAGEIAPVEYAENIIINSSNQEIHMAWHNTVIRDEEGRVIGSLSSGEDITDKRHAEKERASLEERLRQNQKMQAVGTLAGGIAHEFNNMLAIILGYTDMVYDDLPEDSYAKGQLSRVLEAGYRAKDLVMQILTFSRKKIDQKRIVFNLADSIKHTLKLVASSIPSSVEVRTDFRVMDGHILADPAEVSQIIINLCSNAVWAVKEIGNIDITLERVTFTARDVEKVPELQIGEYLKLAIADNGRGMDPEVKERVFEPFFTTKSVGNGTGMGLAMVHGLMEGCGGSVTIESEVGGGTTFYLYFPVAELENSTPEAKPKQDILQKLGKPPAAAVHKKRVLFVDDEKMCADMGKELLASLGYSVVAMTSSKEALEYFKMAADTIDLVITDQIMPELSGDGLAREILSVRPGMPIILCTGFSSQVDEKIAKSIGIKEFVLKPLVKKDIATLIAKVLRENPAS